MRPLRVCAVLLLNCPVNSPAQPQTPGTTQPSQLVQQALATIVIAVLASSVPAFYRTQARQSPVPQALTLVQACEVALGGTQALSAVADYTETGTITYQTAGGTLEGKVTTQGKSLEQLRLQVLLPEGTRTIRITGMAGSLTNEAGQTIGLPYSNLMNAGGLTFPGMRIASLAANSSATLQYVGSVPFADGQAHQIHVVPPLAPDLMPPVGALDFGSFDLYIDPTTFQLVGFSDLVWTPNNSQPLRRELRYSNYQSANGLTVPFRISEIVNGQLNWSISITSLSLNTNPDDSIFKP